MSFYTQYFKAICLEDKERWTQTFIEHVQHRSLKFATETSRAISMKRIFFNNNNMFININDISNLSNVYLVMYIL